MMNKEIPFFKSLFNNTSALINTLSNCFTETFFLGYPVSITEKS